jgi:hypothetical protein
MKSSRPIQILFFMFTIVVFAVGGYVFTNMDITQRLQKMEAFKNEISEKSGGQGFMLPQNQIEGLTIKRGELKDELNAQSNISEPGDANCPDILVKSGSELHLYNSKNPKKEGVNPVVFKNLDEYIRHLETQRKSGKTCPILFLQKENDAQGKDVYRVRPSPFNTGAGLPITSNLNVGVNNTPIKVKDASRGSNYNTNQYAGFDPYGLYVGKITNVDEIGISTEKNTISDNPMDPNWGGVMHTQSAVDSGKYDENIVTRSTYPTPKTEFIPIPNSNIPPPPKEV